MNIKEYNQINAAINTMRAYKIDGHLYVSAINVQAILKTFLDGVADKELINFVEPDNE